MPEVVVLSAIETIKVIRPNGSNRWSGGQDTAKIFLMAPVRAIPPAMLEVVILSPIETISTVGSPRDGGGGRGKRPTKIVLVAPMTPAVPPPTMFQAVICSPVETFYVIWPKRRCSRS